MALLAGAYAGAQLGAFQQGAWLGIDRGVWYWLAVAIPVVHQVYVWVCWRSELLHQWLTRAWGSLGLKLYAVGFAIVGISRVLVVFALAYANRKSVDMSPLLLKPLAVIVLVPAVYLFYSVKRYFTMTRAFGGDHFFENYRTMPFENRSIFRFTNNGMYIYGFLLLWAPPLWFASSAALGVALFNHLYIWVHYFATEKPDIRRIYQ